MLERLIAILRGPREDGNRSAPPQAEAAEPGGSDGSSRTEPDEEAPTDGEGESGRRSLWDLIPRRDYGGRHAETGGLAREEQERSLEAIQAQAEAIEDEDEAAEMHPDDQ